MQLQQHSHLFDVESIYPTVVTLINGNPQKSSRKHKVEPFYKKRFNLKTTTRPQSPI